MKQKYNIQSETQFEQEIFNSLKRIETSQNSNSSSGSGGLDLALISIGGKGGSKSEEFKFISSDILNHNRITDNEKLYFYAELLTKDELDVVARCLNKCGTSQGRNYEILGDINNSFIVLINWIPVDSRGSKDKAKILSVTLSGGLKMTEQVNLKRGTMLRPYNGIAQSFKRTANSGQSIVLTLSKHDPVRIEIEPIKKEKKFEIRMMETDQFGHPYIQVITISADDHDSHKGYKPAFVTRNYTLDDKTGEIYKVTRDCTGEGCPWNYRIHSYPDDKYQFIPPKEAAAEYWEDCHINPDKHGFVYYRKWDGLPCTEIYMIYFRKPTSVCVENCE